MLERKVEWRIFWHADLQRRIHYRRLLADGNFQRDMRQRKILPLRAIMHVHDRARHDPRQREEFPAASLIITHCLLARLANRVRIQSRQFAIFPQHLTV